MARRITQITSCGVSNNQTTQCNAFIHALCDDGTVWLIRDNDGEWLQLPEIPDAPELSETGQQLKAEIAAIVADIERDEKKGVFEKDYYVNRLRQLSAV